jgi:hypothetical protein
MTITYYPFNQGDGANSYQDRWSKMARFWVAGDGVVADADDDLELRVYADSSGMQVKVKPGVMWIRGHRYENDTEATLAISAAHATLGRIDRVIGEVDWTAYTMSVKILTGTAAASPAAPALTQSTSKWQIELAQVTVDAAAVTIAAAKVADYRSWALGTFTLPLRIGNGVNVPGTGFVPGAVQLPVRCKFIKWTGLADASGTLGIQVVRYATPAAYASGTYTSMDILTISSAIQASGIASTQKVCPKDSLIRPYIQATPATIKQGMFNLIFAVLQE